MSRNYRKEYDNYHSRPEQKIRRAARNAARARFKDADPKKDAHHKDNNPLNNDRNNLSLVTQYYNRREPRLRKEVFTNEANYKIKNGKLHISKKDYVKKSKDYKGKRNGKPTLMARDPKTGATTSFEVVFEEVEFDESPIVVANEVEAIELISRKFADLLRKADFNKKQKLAKAVGIKVSLRGKHRVKVEDMGTVTGPHIAGTGDDSSTVVVKKKKKKKDVHVRFKLKNQKSLKKRILDNVLALQQKI